MPDERELLADFLRAHPQYNLAYIDQSTNPPTIHVHLLDPERADPLAAASSFPHHRLRFHGSVKIRPLITHTIEPRAQNVCQECQNEPIKLGCQVQPAHGDWVGTAGAPVRYTDDAGKPRWGFLSNWHVLNGGLNAPNDEQFQPDRQRGPIGRLVASIAPSRTGKNKVDAAFACSFRDGKHTTAWSLLLFGDPSTSPVNASNGLPVVKVGRTTALTHGVCVATGAAVTVAYDGFDATFEDQDVFRSPAGEFSAPGDSGSMILAESCRCPTALLFAGGPDVTIGNPIRHVLAALNLRLDP